MGRFVHILSSRTMMQGDLPKRYNYQFDMEMSQYAFEMFDKKRDVGNVLLELMKKLGEQYKHQHIIIIEAKRGGDVSQLSFEWYRDGLGKYENYLSYFFQNDWDTIFNSYGKDGIFICNNTMKFPFSKEYHNLLSKNNINTYCSLLLMEDGQPYGYMIIEGDRKVPVFTEEELQSYQTLRSLTVSYLLKMKEWMDTKDKLERLMKYDPITGLMRYDNFLKEAENIYKNKLLGCQQYAFIYADIENFNFFNEHYGYGAGDQVLCAFVEHFMDSSPWHILGCRVFSDYFISLVCYEKDQDEKRILTVADFYNRRFTEKLRKIYSEAKVQAVIGISPIIDDTISIKTYIDNANQARKNAKSLPKRSVFYNDLFAEKRKKNLLIANIADEALLRREFYFELQPKYDLKSKQIVGAEALVRWKKKDGTKIYPNDFIPIFEENGFIIKLDFYIYTMVCHYLREQLDKQEKIVPISVNVSRVHLESKNFMNRLLKLVNSYRIPHNYLEFEFTENLFLADEEKAKKVMSQLKEQGFVVSMDDFGAAYSSLSLFKNLEFDVLKLDKDFLDKGQIKKRNAIVLSSIIKMAKLMDTVVLCEGVETEEQAEFLLQADCDLVQGYFFGRPMLIDQFEKLF